MSRLTKPQIDKMRSLGMTFADISEVSGEPVYSIYGRWAEARVPNKRGAWAFRLRMRRIRNSAQANTPEGFWVRERFGRSEMR